MIDLVEKTRQSLIAQHGKNETRVENGYTIRSINNFLIYFEAFNKRFESLLKKLNVSSSNYPRALETMYAYLEQADESSIKEISSSLHRLIRKINENNFEEYQARINTFFENINALSLNPKFNLEQVKVCFADDLGLAVKVGSNMHKNRASKQGWSK